MGNTLVGLRFRKKNKLVFWSNPLSLINELLMFQNMHLIVMAANEKACSSMVYSITLLLFCFVYIKISI